MEGVFNIDKPTGISSHDVVNRLRRLTKIRKIGHAGTLDPLASGVMLLCIGRATRLIEYLVGHSKRYTATIRLGQTTGSYDAEGEIVQERPFTHIQLPDIQKALAQFQGRIEQLPPMYSAIKKDGQPLYKLARQGIEVERKPRQVTIHEIAIVDYSAPNLIINTNVSSGTYIRSLAHDLGELLGCGGHITQLRRTNVGTFTIENSVALDALTSDNIGGHYLPMETAVHHLPRLHVSREEAETLLNGRLIPQNKPWPLDTVAAIFSNNQFWGIAISKENRWKAHKMIPPVTPNSE
ncbi:MAG: tRNA pseudouridine(55) synthase TruB [Chloroflexota bacterium]